VTSTPAPDGVPSDRLRVLVADDDATSRGQLAALVRAKGHAVTTAVDGLDAWVAFDTFQPQLVIVDWLMPGMDGLELCSRIRRRSGDECFVMLVTSREGSQDLQAALAAGADDYLPKPVTADQFWARIVIAARHLALARARRIAEGELARMRWLAGIGHTVVTLQHEVNNPLTALFGALESAAESPDVSPETREHIGAALREADRIADVVRQLSSLEAPAMVERFPGLPMIALAETTRPDHKVRGLGRA
jgi:CheY-like chemotaxis protein